MATINITVSDSEKDWLQYLANLHGTSIAELIKQTALEQLEDEDDRRVFEAAHQKWLVDGRKTVSMADMLKEFENSKTD